MVADPDWRRYVGPAAFLLLATVAILLIRSGLEHRGGGSTVPQVPTGRHVSTRTTSTSTSTSTSETSSRGATRRFWTVQAGDTFEVISSKTGVPVATIEQLNPTVKSTSLHIGERLRIR